MMSIIQITPNTADKIVVARFSSDLDMTLPVSLSSEGRNQVFFIFAVNLPLVVTLLAISFLGTPWLQVTSYCFDKNN